MRNNERRICWPNPDEVCIEGGCIYCNDKPFKSVEEIEIYAEARYMLDSFRWAQTRNWNNAESR